MTPPKPQWTVAIYMGADNSLSDKVEASLKEILETLPSDNVNLFIQVDQDGEEELSGKRQPLRNRLFYVPAWSTPTGVPAPIRRIPNQASGQISTITNFLNWSVGIGFPAGEKGEEPGPDQADERVRTPYYALILWDHGGGWKFAILNDDKNSLTNVELLSAIKDSELYKNFRAGKPLDLVGFDSCLMSSVEVAYQLQGVARRFVASETVAPVSSWPYGALAAKLQAGATAEELADTIVDNYAERNHDRIGHGSISSVNLELVGSLVYALHGLCSTLINAEHQSIYDRLMLARGKMAGLFDGDYVDLGSALRALFDALPEFRDDIRRVARVYHDLSLMRTKAFGLAGANKSGMSIFFPMLPEGRQLLDDYRALEFSRLQFDDGVTRRHGWTRLLFGLPEAVPATEQFPQKRPRQAAGTPRAPAPSIESDPSGPRRKDGLLGRFYRRSVVEPIKGDEAAE
jgi:Clostripain family